MHFAWLCRRVYMHVCVHSCMCMFACLTLCVCVSVLMSVATVSMVNGFSSSTSRVSRHLGSQESL